jgi:glycerophosphoryl diester phosphodiesterase
VKRPLLLGHRGVRATGLKGLAADLPAENSIAAFEYAVAHGCDGFEFDVRHTMDGRNVLWHDPDYLGRPIAATTLAGLTDSQGDHLAVLEDVLRQFGSCAYLDIELKVGGGEESVVAALRANPPQRGYIVSSFLPEVLLRLHQITPDLPLGYICDRKQAVKLWGELPIKVFLPHFSLVQPSLIAEVHQRDLKVMTWTVNDTRRMRQLADWGIDGIVSDDPASLKLCLAIAP